MKRSLLLLLLLPSLGSCSIENDYYRRSDPTAIIDAPPPSYRDAPVSRYINRDNRAEVVTVPTNIRQARSPSVHRHQPLSKNAGTVHGHRNQVAPQIHGHANQVAPQVHGHTNQVSPKIHGHEDNRVVSNLHGHD